MSNVSISEALGYVPKFYENEAIEVRFHGWSCRFQLLATVSQNGEIIYTLHNSPAGKYPLSLTCLNTERPNGEELPMKAREYWQEDLLTWILSAKRKDGTNIYTISEVL